MLWHSQGTNLHVSLYTPCRRYMCVLLWSCNVQLQATRSIEGEMKVNSLGMPQDIRLQVLSLLQGHLVAWSIRHFLWWQRNIPEQCHDMYMPYNICIHHRCFEFCLVIPMLCSCLVYLFDVSHPCHTPHQHLVSYMLYMYLSTFAMQCACFLL